MKKSNIGLLLLLILAVAILGCQDSTSVVESSSSETGNASFQKPGVPDAIDFESIAPGTIVDEVYGANGTGPIGVYAYNPALSALYPAGANAAVIFPSDNPPNFDFELDMGTPNETFGGPGVGEGGEMGQPYENGVAMYNILIINKEKKLLDRDGNGIINHDDSPAVQTFETDHPGCYTDFDFSSVGNGHNNTVTVNSVTIMDVEREEGEDGTYLVLSGPNLPPNLISIPPVGNNGIVTIDNIGLEGVSLLRVQMNGSGGIAGMTINQDEPRSCWITTGGFHNAGVSSGGKDFTFGGNVGPPSSGSWEVIDHNTGDNFHSNDVHIDSCRVIAHTGPGQPGGNKGFDINKAYWSGTGSLNHVDGYPFVGYVIDGGEPGGKKNNQKDEFWIQVYDPVTHAVVFETQFELDGGNVQIHPCNDGQCN